MKILNFTQWKETETRIFANSSKEIKCIICDGHGDITEECECCESEYERECGLCEGIGKIIPNEHREEALSPYFTTDRYKDELSKSCEALATYLGIDLSKLYYDNGIVAYCQIYYGKKISDKLTIYTY